MRIITSGGSQFNLKVEESPLNYAVFEIAPPNSTQFQRVTALIDTGANGVVIPTELVEDLGMNGVLPYLGNMVADTAGGASKEPISKVIIRIIGIPSGQPTLIQGIEVTVSEHITEPLIGMSVLRFFGIQIKAGKLIYLEFDPKSVEIAQKSP